MEWTVVLIPLAITVVFSLLARRFPAPPAAPATGPVSPKFKLAYNLAQFALFIPVALGLALAVHQAATWMGPALRPGDLALYRPEWVYLILPALFLGMLFTGKGLEWFARRCWPAHLAAYEADMTTRTGVNWKRLERPVTIGIWLISLTLFVLFADFYTRFGQEGLVANRFLGLGPTSHPWVDLDKITFSGAIRLRDGTVKPSPSLTLAFKDGYEWQSRFAPVPTDRHSLVALAEAVSQATAVPVSEVEVR